MSRIILIVAIVAATVHGAKSASDGCFCTREYRPICASNGRTYSNNCQFECAKWDNDYLQIQFYGECNEQFNANIQSASEFGLRGTQECVCTSQYMPICASNGQTFANLCVFYCEKRHNSQLNIKHRGECKRAVQTQPFVDCICTFIYQPVCGSDYNDYPNLCALNCAKRRNPYLYVMRQGRCDGGSAISDDRNSYIPKRSCNCPALYAPVCGTDDRIYSNKCFLGCAQLSYSDLNLKHYGACNEI